MAAGHALLITLCVHAEKCRCPVDCVHNRFQQSTPFKLVCRDFPAQPHANDNINKTVPQFILPVLTHLTGVVAPEPPRDEQVFAFGGIIILDPPPLPQQAPFAMVTIVVVPA